MPNKHTNASLLIAANTDIKTVVGRLGHIAKFIIEKDRMLVENANRRKIWCCCFFLQRDTTERQRANTI